MGGGGAIRGLLQIIFCPNNPLLCDVITIIYLLLVKSEHPQIQIVNIKHEITCPKMVPTIDKCVVWRSGRIV